MAVVNILENPSQLQSTEEHQTSRFFEDFDFVKLLGKGAFGCVCVALKKKEEKHFTVKCIEFEEENVQLGNREVKVLSGLKHRNIVSYYNAWWEKNPAWEYFVKKSRNFIYLYIQMELCREENLAQWLKTREPVQLNENQIIREILSAVKYLHRQKLVHRDLSPNNIFFGFNLSIKVGDFGSTKELIVDESFQATNSEGLQDPQSKQVSVTGTVPYIAPELVNSSSYNHKVDVYSLGIILFEIIMGPFKTDSERSSHIRLLN
ncbi:hypothetical protein DAPPUDRAFT_65929 [Daphnia pulex]|uniref:Protein kinase domain-containing protein n=1 Tax=Daphnia pulex TaxID=6669 RepID=E9HU21_DAPPU|nr:hypothetical protein DAPPUDRAFT_65929 [Daphnia pulex]|eukprot:EFX64750.1 hypothetical protein DAPPUDRAFT_65929 [Daphnia pulex]